eukprot:503705-Amphidinium_carterae.1
MQPDAFSGCVTVVCHAECLGAWTSFWRPCRKVASQAIALRWVWGLDWAADDKASSTFAAGFRKRHFVRSHDDLKVRKGNNGSRLKSWAGSNAL